MTENIQKQEKIGKDRRVKKGGNVQKKVGGEKGRKTRKYQNLEEEKRKRKRGKEQNGRKQRRNRILLLQIYFRFLSVPSRPTNFSLSFFPSPHPTTAPHFNSIQSLQRSAIFHLNTVLGFWCQLSFAARVMRLTVLFVSVSQGRRHSLELATRPVSRDYSIFSSGKHHNNGSAQYRIVIGWN